MTTPVPPVPGETCECGQPATGAYLTPSGMRVPFCGTPYGMEAAEAEVTE